MPAPIFYILLLAAAAVFAADMRLHHVMCKKLFFYGYIHLSISEDEKPQLLTLWPLAHNITLGEFIRQNMASNAADMLLAIPAACDKIQLSVGKIKREYAILIENKGEHEILDAQGMAISDKAFMWRDNESITIKGDGDNDAVITMTYRAEIN